MHFLRPADYAVIVFYLCFLVVIGIVFRRFNRDISDYFRGGGTMLWWMSGASAMMSAISAWSFTGAAGSVYDTGLLVAVIYWSNALILVFVYKFSSWRFRRMRVVTYAEAIRRRYGTHTEQFYVWVQLPMSLVKSGIELCALGVFMSAVFRTEVLLTVTVLGAVVIAVALLGGAWAVVAGDFVQSILMFLVMCLAVGFSLRMPEIGGLSGLMQKLGREHLPWGGHLGGGIVALWCVAALVNSFFNFNNMAEGAARFLTVKDEVQAKKAAMALVACFVVLPFVLLIPPLTATVIFPDLHASFPALKNAHEAAFVSVCLRTMPAGVVGLLVAGIFAVAMATMDTGLNRNSGLFVRNFYQRFIRPRAEEGELLLTGKISTLVFGLAIVCVARSVAEFTTLDLFNLILVFSSLVTLPLMIPTVFGLFFRRAPDWAGWSTALAGLSAGAILRYEIGVPRLASWLGWTQPSSLELDCLAYGLTVLFVVGSSGLWFAFTSWLKRAAQEPLHVTEFFTDLLRPIDAKAEGVRYDDKRQYRTMGILCMAYGSGVVLFAIITNSFSGRVSFLFCGGIIALVGACLKRASTKERAFQ